MKSRSAIGKNNRAKGHKLERDVVNDFKGLGWSNAKTSRAESKNRDDQKVDLCFTDPYNVQCKATIKCINYVEILSEMPVEENANIIVNRIKNKGDFVILGKDDFLELIKKI